MKYESEVKGRARYGVIAFANSLLTIPKNLAVNSGYDSMDSLVKLREEYKNSGGSPVGLDISTGEVLNPVEAGIFDNYCVKLHMLDACSVIARNLLIVDEIMRAGLSQLK